jgi:DNA ligase (NAD+)
MDIGCAEATIEQLYNLGLLKNIADFYNLSKEMLLGLDRFAKKSAGNLIDSIDASKKVPFERVLYAIGIRYVGETVAKKIVAHFKSIDTLSFSTPEDLVQVDEIGEVIAKSIIAWFANKSNQELITRLKEAGVQLSSADNSTRVSDWLSGKSFVISGVFKHHSREEIQRMIEEHGGKNLSGVSSYTSYIVAGEGMGPSKREKAIKLGVSIITEQEFLAMIEKKAW